MNKDIKLKYKNIIGYGYKLYSYEINTYIIIKTKNKIKHIFYKCYEFSSPKRKNEIIELLEKEGFKNIEVFESTKSLTLVNKK